MLTRVLYVRANCMCKLGCFKHSANEIFNLLHYVLIKPQFKCNWKTISSLYENYALQKFVVFYLFDFLKLLIILIITLIWQCHVVSKTLLTFDLDSFDYWFYRPLSTFFLFDETTRGKETLSCTQLPCILILKNRTTLL